VEQNVKGISRLWVSELNQLVNIVGRSCQCGVPADRIHRVPELVLHDDDPLAANHHIPKFFLVERHENHFLVLFLALCLDLEKQCSPIAYEEIVIVSYIRLFFGAWDFEDLSNSCSYLPNKMTIS
jgi:hypothetical protein